MNLRLLATSARWLTPMVLALAALLLWRGHNEPGGGFIAGLVAAGALVLQLLASESPADDLGRLRPERWIVAGLSTSLVSGLVATASGAPLLTGAWVTLPLPGGDVLKLGTPLLFDVGVFAVVVGFVGTFVLGLAGVDAERTEAAREAP